MNVRIVERVERDQVEVYFFYDEGGPTGVGPDGGRAEFAIDEGGRLVPDWHVREGQEMRPTLIFRASEWAMLVEAIRREGPAGSVEQAALADTRQVRDRLLVMVERVMEFGYPRSGAATVGVGGAGIGRPKL